MARNRRSGRNTSTKKSNHSWLYGVLVIVGIVAAGLAYGLMSDSKGPSDSSGTSETAMEIEKPKVSNKNADYRTSTRKLQDQIERSLKELGGTLRRTEDEDRESERGNGGKIYWNFRAWEIALPGETTVDEAAQGLLAKFNKEKKLEILTTSLANQGRLLTIFLLDELGGAPLRIKTAEIAILSGPSSPAPKKPKPTSRSGKLAIVIDDFGYRGDLIPSFSSYSHRLTFAILPHHEFSGTAAQSAKRAGKEYILHLPMEALGNANEESSTIHVGDSQEKIDQIIQSALSTVPGAVGINNHQGSKVTSDPETIHKVMRSIKKRGVFFLDSKTSGNSVAESTARSVGILSNSNHLFLDGQSDVGYIKSKIRQGAEAAQRNGSYIVIGHDRPTTLQALKEMESYFDEIGVEIVPVSQLLY